MNRNVFIEEKSMNSGFGTLTSGAREGLPEQDSPVKFSGKEVRSVDAAPRVGEGHEEIDGQFLGDDPEKRVVRKKEGVI